MVAVFVDGPVGEDDVGVFGCEEFGEFLIMGVIDNGLSVDLFREDRVGLEDLTGLFGFGGANAGAIGIW